MLVFKTSYTCTFMCFFLSATDTASNKDGHPYLLLYHEIHQLNVITFIHEQGKGIFYIKSIHKFIIYNYV